MHILTVGKDYDYESSGYVVKCNLKNKNVLITEDTYFSIYSYSHCSCDGTSDGISDEKLFYGNYKQFYEYIKK